MQRETLQEELKNARTALNLTREKLAMYGISAPVHLIMEERGLAQKVAQLQAALGQTPTEPRVLPDAPAPHKPVYAPPVERDYAAERTRARQADIDHQLDLLNIHRRALKVLRAQADAHGGWRFAPFHLKTQMDDRRAGIAEIKRALDQLGGAYDNLPGDE